MCDGWVCLHVMQLFPAYGNVRSVRICLKYLWRIRNSLVCFALAFTPGVTWMVSRSQTKNGLAARDYYWEGMEDMIVF